MVPALLYLLFRKIVRKHWPKGFFLLLLAVNTAGAQTTTLNYKITRNDNVIGWTSISRYADSINTRIVLKSEIKTRFIFQFNISAREEVTMHRGVITRSAQFRKMNGDVKEDKEMRFTINGYEVYKDSKVQKLPFFSLRANILSLYFQEPVTMREVFSDKFQQMIAVQSLGNGLYRLKLPDGNSSIYHYENGVCVKVEIKGSLYSANMTLSQ